MGNRIFAKNERKQSECARNLGNDCASGCLSSVAIPKATVYTGCQCLSEGVYAHREFNHDGNQNPQRAGNTGNGQLLSAS